MNMGNVNILVVDDDNNTRNYLAKILSMKDWRVDTARDGPNALQFVQGKKYDAVVLDFRMPGMDGAELCRRIRKLQPDAHAVFLTGFANTNMVAPAIDAGAERILAKPVNPKELVTVLEERLTCPKKSDSDA